MAPSTLNGGGYTAVVVNKKGTSFEHAKSKIWYFSVCKALQKNKIDKLTEIYYMSG